MRSGHKEDVSEFLKLATIFHTLPANSAQAERLFSPMNFLKNDAWNSLGEAHLNDAVALKLQHSLKNFLNREALTIFLSAKDSRGLGHTMDQSAAP